MAMLLPTPGTEAGDWRVLGAPLEPLTVSAVLVSPLACLRVRFGAGMAGWCTQCQPTADEPRQLGAHICAAPGALIGGIKSVPSPAATYFPFHSGQSWRVFAFLFQWEVYGRNK